VPRCGILLCLRRARISDDVTDLSKIIGIGISNGRPHSMNIHEYNPPIPRSNAVWVTRPEVVQTMRRETEQINPKP
jgi:hypothetical protein